jgi:hypothetical protein
MAAHRPFGETKIGGTANAPSPNQAEGVLCFPVR